MKLSVKIILAVTISFSSCSTKQDEITEESVSIEKKEAIRFSEPGKLLAYVDNDENGYIKNKKIKEFVYSAVLKPIDYLLAQKKISDQNNNYKKSDFEDLQYFDLRIKVEDFKMEFMKYQLSNVAQYDERVKYCAFEMQNDIKLIDGKDTLRCIMFHFERSFDVVPYGHFLLGFENKKKSTIDSKTLCFNDRLFNNGTIKFTYTPRFLIKEPALL